MGQCRILSDDTTLVRRIPPILSIDDNEDYGRTWLTGAFLGAYSKATKKFFNKFTSPIQQFDAPKRTTPHCHGESDDLDASSGTS